MRRSGPMCEVCSHASEFGSWPEAIMAKGGTHCSDSIDNRGVVVIVGCHRTWFSKAQSHCASCHRHFGSDSAGDNHRVGDYRSGKTPQCRDPQGFDRWETDEGVVWGGRDPSKPTGRPFTPGVGRGEHTESQSLDDSLGTHRRSNDD